MHYIKYNAHKDYCKYFKKTTKVISMKENNTVNTTKSIVAVATIVFVLMMLSNTKELEVKDTAEYKQ